MFIYDYLLESGTETLENILDILKKRGIESIGIVDTFDSSLDVFLKVCERKEMKVSIAIPFKTFFQGHQEKEEGYLVSAEPKGIKKMYQLHRELTQSFFQMIDNKALDELFKNDVYCLSKLNDTFIEKKNLDNDTVKIIAFLTENQKENCELFCDVKDEISLEDIHIKQKQSVLINRVSGKPTNILNFLEIEKRFFDVVRYNESMNGM